jgi:hypothetical protein
MTIPLGFIANARSVVSGGTLTSDSTYYYRTFTTNGSLSVAGAPLTFDALIIGGGGSSGHTNWFGATGGGGAGGVRLASAVRAPIGTHSVVVGAGGTFRVVSGFTIGSPGETSSILSNTATGGGAGGTMTRTGPESSLSGGGQGSPTSYGGGSGGADFWDGQAGGGGGGGAAGAGTSAQEYLYQGQYIAYIAGTGGAGTSTYSSWASATGTGVSGVYAKGGNGFASGGGTSPPTTAQPANTGNGGYGEAAGGSGLVIVRYLKTAVAV